jgi:hypothetical protein
MKCSEPIRASSKSVRPIRRLDWAYVHLTFACLLMASFAACRIPIIAVAPAAQSVRLLIPAACVLCCFAILSPFLHSVCPAYGSLPFLQKRFHHPTEGFP